jgi:hypothetical protein
MAPVSLFAQVGCGELEADQEVDGCDAADSPGPCELQVGVGGVLEVAVGALDPVAQGV